MGQFSPIHWLIVLLVIVLLFGGKKIPEVIRELGEGIRGDFRGGSARSRRPRGPQHPIPVTGPIETKKAEKEADEQKAA